MENRKKVPFTPEFDINVVHHGLYCWSTLGKAVPSQKTDFDAFENLQARRV